MQIVNPISIDDAAYAASNIAEDDYEEWEPSALTVSGPYAGFVDALQQNFRLCTLNLETGALAGVGSKVDIETLVGTHPEGCSILQSGDDIYAGFVDANGDDFRLCTLDLTDGTLTAVGSKVDISTLVGSGPFGCSLLLHEGTAYAGFVDAFADDFRLCTLDLTDGTLTAVGSKVDISTLVGNHPNGCSLLESEGTIYAGFVDATANDFRLCTLDLATAALTAVGSKVDINTLVGADADGCSLLKSDDDVYAAFVDDNIGEFRLCTLDLATAALTAVGSKVDINTLVGNNPNGIGAAYISQQIKRGEFRIVPSTHSVYQCLRDHIPTQANSPTTEAAAFADPLTPDPDPANWIYVSRTNKWRLFDGRPSQQTENDSTISAELAVENVDRIAFLELADCTSIEVTMRDGGDSGTQVYNRTVTVTEDEDDLLLDDIPEGNTADYIEIELSGGSDLACGQIVLGEADEHGLTQAGDSGFEGLDFSEVEVNPYGDLVTVERATTTLHRFDVRIPVEEVGAFRLAMKRLKGGRRALWIGDATAGVGGWVYGWSRDYNIYYTDGVFARTRIQVQGVV